MQHPFADIPLPPIVDRLVEVVQAATRRRGSDWQRTVRALQPLPDPDPIFCHLAFGSPLETPAQWADPTHPPEVVPLFWSGGDGLLYGLVWWDAAVPPMGVSYAPDGTGCAWLGDDPTDAVRNLLSWMAFDAGAEPWADPTLAVELREEGLALAARLELELVEPSPLESGARSERMVRPTLPPGWHHVPDADGVGTVAPRSAFRPGPSLDLGTHPHACLDTAAAALREGFAGTALAAARRAARLSGGDPEARRRMAACLRALGRHGLARLAEQHAALRAAATV